MWRSRRGATLIRQAVGDFFEGLAGRGDMERRMMRTERPRAMREAVHAACREGLVAGASGRNVALAYGFPHGLPPIEGDYFGPRPAGPASPAGPEGPAGPSAGQGYS
jgi:hypothetical protein